jgi:hypothetical protein
MVEWLAKCPPYRDTGKGYGSEVAEEEARQHNLRPSDTCFFIDRSWELGFN